MHCGLASVGYGRTYMTMIRLIESGTCDSESWVEPRYAVFCVSKFPNGNITRGLHSMFTGSTLVLRYSVGIMLAKFQSTKDNERLREALPIFRTLILIHVEIDVLRFLLVFIMPLNQCKHPSLLFLCNRCSDGSRCRLLLSCRAWATFIRV